MSKIKIGAQVTAKVRPTKVTVSGTFQGYRLEDQEDPTSICGTVLHVKDGMQHLDYVYVDSIKVCESKDERIRKSLVKYFGMFTPGNMWDEMFSFGDVVSYLEKKKEQKTVTCIEFDNEFKNQVSHLLASVLNRELEYNNEFVEYTAQQLLGYAKHEINSAERGKKETSDESKQECDSINVFSSIKISRIKTLENLISYFRCERKSTQEEINTSFLPYLENLLKDIESTSKPAEWSAEDKKMLNGIIERGNSEIPKGECGLTPNQVAWLETRLKSLRPQPKQDRPEVELEKEIQAFAMLELEPLKIYDANVGITITMHQLYQCAKHFYSLGLAQKGEEV